MDFVLATTNLGKFEFFSHFLSQVSNVRMLSLGDFKSIFVVDKPYDTAEENARYKAVVYAKELNKPVLASDIALFVDFLPSDQQPGVHVRRLVDKKTRMSDEEIYEYWVKKLQGQSGNPRGYWYMAFALATPQSQWVEDVFDRHFVFRLDKAAKEYQPGLPMGGLCYNEYFGKMHADMTKQEILESCQELAGIFLGMLERTSDI